MKILSIIILLAITTNLFASGCHGKFVNPITDVCWRCIFPISIGPVTLNAHDREDTANPQESICFCPRGPIPAVPGISVGFWEPVRMVDIVRRPYCMVGLGGISFGGNPTIGHGYHGLTTDAKHGSETSFYQAHWYIYPLISWLELITDFLCLDSKKFDVAYLTELDPLWNDDELSLVLNAEVSLFSNPISQAACAFDCVSASSEFALDSLFWCAGCQGSMYPFTGNVAAHIGGVQASMLLTQRLIAKLHRSLLLYNSSGRKALCRQRVAPIIKKTQYKIQMLYPRATSRDGPGFKCCMPIGRTGVFFGSGREYPEKGEDYSYLIWRKRNCCII